MAIAPVRIKSPINLHREMIAFAHRARLQADRKPRPAVLLLNPFGQEAVRTHRLLRVLADRLARAGHDVLRFDYHGTGDSPGEDLNANLVHFAQDALAAADALAAMTKASTFTWLGIRLGASVALQATQILDSVDLGNAEIRGPGHLVLWEPVLDGAAHLKALGADHRRALLSTYSLPAHAQALSDQHQASWPPTELMGFEVSAQLSQQISSLQGKQLAVGSARISLPVTPQHRCQASAMSHPADPAHESGWRQACLDAGARFEHFPASVEFDWTSEEALNTALVPAPAVAAILEAVTKHE